MDVVGKNFIMDWGEAHQPERYTPGTDSHNEALVNV